MSKLPDPIRRRLFEILSRAADLAWESRSDVGVANFAVDDSEHVDQQAYAELRTYFIGTEFNFDLLRAEASRYSSGQRTPLVTREELLATVIESLMEVAGVERIFNPGHFDAAKVISRFEAALGAEPTSVTYLPVYNVAVPIDYSMPAVRLAPEVCLRLLDPITRTFTREAMRLTSGVSNPNGMATCLPELVLEIETPLSENRGIDAGILDTVAAFATFSLGVLGADIYLPANLWGVRTPWHPWYRLSSHSPATLPEMRGYQQWGQFEVGVFRRYWNDLIPVLGKYRLTAERLRTAQERVRYHDRVVDIAVALESLVNAKHEITWRLAMTAAVLSSDTPESRPKVFDDVTLFYDIRSSVVHGNSKDLKDALKKAPSDLDRKMEQLARELLCVHLLNPHVRTKDGQRNQILGAGKPLLRKPVID